MCEMEKSQEYLQDKPDSLIVGRNAVNELLATDREVESIYIQKGNLQGTALKIVAIAKQKGIPVKEVAPAKLDHLAGGTSHQGVAALLAAYAYSTLEAIVDAALSSESPAFIILADGIEDPHNLGAIIRTAEAAGAHGLIIPKRRSAGLSPIVSKTSAGAALYLPVARVPNLVDAIRQLKKRGIWIYGADASGQSWNTTDLTGHMGLVVGAEGEGISRLVKENCDFVVALPMLGQTNSLNASVAAGILMYETVRQRGAAKHK